MVDIQKYEDKVHEEVARVIGDAKEFQAEAESFLTKKVLITAGVSFATGFMAALVFLSFI